MKDIKLPEECKINKIEEWTLIIIRGGGNIIEYNLETKEAKIDCFIRDGYRGSYNFRENNSELPDILRPIEKLRKIKQFIELEIAKEAIRLLNVENELNGIITYLNTFISTELVIKVKSQVETLEKQIATIK